METILTITKHTSQTYSTSYTQTLTELQRLQNFRNRENFSNHLQTTLPFPNLTGWWRKHNPSKGKYMLAVYVRPGGQTERLSPASHTICSSFYNCGKVCILRDFHVFLAPGISTIVIQQMQLISESGLYFSLVYQASCLVTASWLTGLNSVHWKFWVLLKCFWRPPNLLGKESRHS